MNSIVTHDVTEKGARCYIKGLFALVDVISDGTRIYNAAISRD